MHDYGQPCKISCSIDNFQEAIFMNNAVDKLESVKASFEHWRKTRARQY